MKGLKRQGGWVGGALVAGSILKSGSDSRKASRKARRQNKKLIAETNALIEMEAEEDLRKMELSHQQIKREVIKRARHDLSTEIAGSGLTKGGTNKGGFNEIDAYEQRLEKEFGAQRRWRIKQKNQQQKINKQGGKYTRDTIRANQQASDINTFTNAIGAFFMGG